MHAIHCSCTIVSRQMSGTLIPIGNMLIVYEINDIIYRYVVELVVMYV
jgi:hypothetical protein